MAARGLDRPGGPQRSAAVAGSSGPSAPTASTGLPIRTPSGAGRDRSRSSRVSAGSHRRRRSTSSRWNRPSALWQPKLRCIGGLRPDLLRITSIIAIIGARPVPPAIMTSGAFPLSCRKNAPYGPEISITVSTAAWPSSHSDMTPPGSRRISSSIFGQFGGCGGDRVAAGLIGARHLDLDELAGPEIEPAILREFELKPHHIHRDLFGRVDEGMAFHRAVLTDLAVIRQRKAAIALRAGHAEQALARRALRCQQRRAAAGQRAGLTLHQRGEAGGAAARAALVEKGSPAANPASSTLLPGATTSACSIPSLKARVTWCAAASCISSCSRLRSSARSIRAPCLRPAGACRMLEVLVAPGTPLPGLAMPRFQREASLRQVIGEMSVETSCSASQPVPSA